MIITLVSCVQHNAVHHLKSESVTGFLKQFHFETPTKHLGKPGQNHLTSLRKN